MARVFIGVGSNIGREKNIRAGLHEMRRHFGDVKTSKVYESRAVGFEGENFYNLVAEFRTELGPAQVADRLHAIEQTCGRGSSTERNVPRTLDLDLLLYDDMVCSDGKLSLPREDVTRFAFVLKPLAELAGDLRHPVTGQTFAELWARFEDDRQALWPAEFDTSPQSSAAAGSRV